MISIKNTAIQPKSIRIVDANENDEGYDAYDAFDGDEHDDGYDACEDEDEDDEDEDEDDDDDGDGDGDGAGAGAGDGDGDGDGDGGDVDGDGDGDGDGDDRSHPLKSFSSLGASVAWLQFWLLIVVCFSSTWSISNIFKTWLPLTGDRVKWLTSRKYLQRKFKCYGQFSKQRPGNIFSFHIFHMDMARCSYGTISHISRCLLCCPIFLSDLWNPIKSARSPRSETEAPGQRAVDVNSSPKSEDREDR